MNPEFRPAVRESVGLLIGIAAPSGGGKTYSAMRLAAGIAGEKRFAVIDTEARRALHYADRFQFDHLDFRPPFSPDRYAEAILAADRAGYPVIVVDSATHEYAGEGGILDMQEEAFQDMGAREAVKMASWIKPKSAHKRFVSKLLQVRAHLILLFRAEEKVEMRKGQNGKMEIVPKQTLSGYKGWLPITEKSLPFELTASFVMTPDHPGHPQPIKLQEQHKALFPPDKPIDEESGRRIAQWAAGDLPRPPGLELKPPKGDGSKVLPGGPCKGCEKGLPVEYSTVAHAWCHSEGDELLVCRIQRPAPDAPVERITEEQLANIHALLDEVTPGAKERNELIAKTTNWAGVQYLEQLPASKYAGVITALENRRKG